MKTVAFLLFFLFLIIAGSGAAGAQWKHGEGNLPPWSLFDAIDASDSLTAVAAVRLTSTSTWPLYRTVNGGATWSALPIPVDFGAIDVAMTDSSHLWFVTGSGRLYGSANGGKTWDLQFFDTTKAAFLNYIEMFNAGDGVAMGDNNPLLNRPPVFLHTSNGGVTWTPVMPAALAGEWSGDVWRKLDFIDARVGFFKGAKGNLIYKTTDGGATWTVLLIPRQMQVIKFFNESIGLGASSFADTTPQTWMYRTTNGGASWDLFNVSTNSGWPVDIEFVPGDAAKVWCTVSRASMYFSGDTGRTWTEQKFDSAKVVGRDIALVPGGYGWFGSDNRLLYRTSSTGSVLNVQTAAGEPAIGQPASFALDQNFPNPFNPSTTIRYTLPRAGYATLKIFSVLGAEIATLAAGEYSAGAHTITWDATTAAGVYFYRLRSGALTSTKKLVIVK